MISFGSCISFVLLTYYRHRMKKTVSGLAAGVQGVVRSEHPKSLESIRLTLHIKAKDLTEPETEQARKLAEEKMCPVMGYDQRQCRD